MSGNDHTRKLQLLRAAGLLLLAALACRPVITIGWGELLIVAFISALFFGPLLARIVRKIGGNRNEKDPGDED